ncbi:mast cell protease 3-like [Copidosoma floridanum]|uniref:mast cell protease 3-like n=1 Tax=Copidosoma floridanum TaxID=29053 RepID=UPI0006C9817D|nr:mast cell protease 3-like [Copidosoma floridanum]
MERPLGDVSDDQMVSMLVAKADLHLGDRDEFSYYVTIEKSCQNHYEYSCGGVLIEENFVLSRAHCVSFDLAMLTVIAGGIESNDENTQKSNVTKIFFHSDYDNRTQQNDIVVLQLEVKIDVNRFVSVINLPDENALIDSDKITKLVGRRYFDETNRIGIGFLEVKFARGRCTTSKLKKNLCITSTGNEDLLMYATDILIQNDGNDTFLIGFASVENDIFTRISLYVKWIRDEILKAKKQYNYEQQYKGDVVTEVGSQCNGTQNVSSTASKNGKFSETTHYNVSTVTEGRDSISCDRTEDKSFLQLEV